MADQKNERVYKLKAMVVARLCAELTVLVVLVAVPLILLFSGQFWQLSLLFRALSAVCAIGALILLPAYGFVTYKVLIDEQQLRTTSLFSKQSVNWSDLRAMTLRSTWGARRFVIETANEQGELTFPVWLENIKELTGEIRQRLPNRGPLIQQGPRAFEQGLPASFMQAGKVLSGIFFVVIFWLFFYSLLQDHASGVSANQAARHAADPLDKAFILLCCCLFSLIMFLRCALLIVLPRLVVIDVGGLKMRSLAGQRAFAWSDVKEMGVPLFFLPECLLVRTKQGFFLLGDQLDGFDELEEAITDQIKRGSSPSK